MKTRLFIFQKNPHVYTMYIITDTLQVSVILYMHISPGCSLVSGTTEPFYERTADGIYASQKEGYILKSFSVPVFF